MNTKASTTRRLLAAPMLEMLTTGHMTYRAIAAYLGTVPSVVHYHVQRECARRGVVLVLVLVRVARYELRSIASDSDEGGESAA